MVGWSLNKEFNMIFSYQCRFVHSFSQWTCMTQKYLNFNRSDNKKKSRKFLNHVCVTWICSVFSFIFREVDQQSAGAYLVEYFGFLCLYFQVWNRSLDYCLAQNWRRKSHNPLKVSWYRFNLQEVLILSFIFTFAVSLSI